MNTKEISNYSIGKLINYLLKDFHKPILDDLEQISNYIKTIGNKPEYKEKFSLTKEVFSQLIYELTNHLQREKQKFFPELLKLEKDNVSTLNIKNFLRLQKKEHGEIHTYLDGAKNLLEKIDINNNDFYEFKKMSEKSYEIIIKCISIEDKYLLSKIKTIVEN